MSWKGTPREDLQVDRSGLGWLASPSYRAPPLPVILSAPAAAGSTLPRMERIIECVPNFSEGRDEEVLAAISAAVEAVDGVWLLDVDPGRATNRTVFTFAGEPEAVVEAAVAAARVGAERIDMRTQTGEHPRFGGMDVCPLVPVRGVTMEETVEYARELGRRLGEEVGLTIYLYENAATRPERRNLATVRAGEYEGLEEKLGRAEWKPDFGPAEFQPRTGATAVGAREFLIAYNVNLNTTSTRRANAIAFDVRERGRIQREGNPLTGPIVRDEHGEAVWKSGSLKSVKAIGWFIEEYGVAQISMNLTDVSVTPMHVAFDECADRARARGVRVTGSELVGMVPLSQLLDAGRHYLRRQQRSVGIPDREIVHIAIKSLGLDELGPFDPDEKVLEWKLARLAGATDPLADSTVRGFVERTASEAVAPGGGSTAANVGALGAALGTMVANLSAHKRGWDERWEEFSDWAERGKALHTELTELIDEDTRSYDGILTAFRMSASTPAEEEAKAAAIQAATLRAIEVPFRTMEVAREALDVIRAMAEIGLPSAASDAGVGALCARTAIRGAYLNVRINLKDLDDPAAAERFVREGARIEAEAERIEREVLGLLEGKLG